MLHSAIIALTSLVLILSCQSSHKATSVTLNENSTNEAHRNPAASDDQQMEHILKIILTDANSAQKQPVKNTYFERQLNIYYRADFYVEQFEKDLKNLSQQVKNNPQYVPRPLASKSYANLIKYWRVSNDVLDKITWLYRRLLEISVDSKMPIEQQNAALVELKDIHDWLDSRSTADKLQMIEVYQELKEIKQTHDKKMLEKKTSQNPQTNYKLNRMVASVQGFNFQGWSFLEKKNLNHDFKAQRKVTHKNAVAAFKTENPFLTAAADFVVEDAADRAPSSSNPAIPDPGPDGNFFGLGCPVGTFVLSFDDGPKKASTERLLGILQSHSDKINPTAPADFFVLLQNVRKYPDTVTTENTLGYGIHNHSFSHPDLATVSHDQMVKEVVDTTPELKIAIGRNFRFFRCPYGSCVAPKVPAVRQMIADAGLIHAHWSIDSLDWKNIGQSDRTFEIVKQQMKLVKRGTILMHDIHESSVDAAAKVLAYIKEQNDSEAQKIRLVSLEQAVDDYNAAAGKK